MVALMRMKRAENFEQICKYAEIKMTNNQFIEAIMFI